MGDFGAYEAAMADGEGGDNHVEVKIDEAPAPGIHTTPPPPPPPPSGSDTLNCGDMQPNSKLVSNNGQYEFSFQGDCNLVVYSSGEAIWASDTNGHGDSRLSLQGDGNLVIYNGGNAIWASDTNGKASNPHLVMQDDGNCVMYEGSRAIWCTRTDNGQRSPNW